MIATIRLLRSFAVVFSLLCSCALATTVVPSASLDELRGAWLGGSEANSEYFRLEIDSGGKGILTVLYGADERAAAYDVLSTRLSGYEIQFQLRPRDGAESIFLRGTANLSGLDLKVGGIKGGWRRKVALEPEHEVLSRIEAVTKRAREVSSPAD